MEATVEKVWQRLQACSISSCTTSQKQEFVGLYGTTHKRLCGLRSGVGGQFRVITQSDPHFGITCKSEGYKSLSVGKKRRDREVLGTSHCKASLSSSYSVSDEALHFL